MLPLFLLLFSAAYKQAIAAEQEMMTTALEEISEFCDKSCWLSEIHAYCKGWTEDSVMEWRGVQAFNIEVCVCVCVCRGGVCLCVCVCREGGGVHYIIQHLHCLFHYKYVFISISAILKTSTVFIIRCQLITFLAKADRVTSVGRSRT